MRRQTNILFYILSLYVVLQFTWWGYHLIQLSREIDPSEANLNRRILMIFGEGSVFFIILTFGIWQIRRSIKKEVELSQRQSNFLLSVTHELKTPIASTKLFLQTLQRRNLNEQKREEITSRAIEENERLELLIENILNATRIENNALQPVKSNFQFSELAHQVKDRFHKRYSKEFIQIEIESDAQIIADKFLVETILTNLLENAVKYAGIESNIRIKARPVSFQYLISIEDFGPGIETEASKHIFEKFYRVGNEDVRTTKGSGLGLYIVREFIHLMGGEITHKNNQPKGSIFELTLPL